jgi:hypothetical protein
VSIYLYAHIKIQLYFVAPKFMPFAISLLLRLYTQYRFESKFEVTVPMPPPPYLFRCKTSFSVLEERMHKAPTKLLFKKNFPWPLDVKLVKSLIGFQAYVKTKYKRKYFAILVENVFVLNFH